jgi:hypothetical protein
MARALTALDSADRESLEAALPALMRLGDALGQPHGIPAGLEASGTRP